MKKPITVIFFVLLCAAASAQSSSPIATLTRVTINMRNTDELPGHPGIFNHFEVIDERPDTSRIGIHLFVPTFGANRAKQLVLHRSASLELESYLNTHFTTAGATYTALVVLRDLWLSDANYLREDLIKDPDKFHNRTHIRLKAEIYATKDSLYMPILRYDTNMIYKRDNRYTDVSYYASWGNNLTGILNNMADSAEQLTIDKDGHSRLVSREDIRNFDRTRFIAPISVAATLKAGVYTNFDEFRNNSPSLPDFEVKVENKERLLYVKDADGKSYYSHDAWGYCDGKDFFVMRDGQVCRLWREGNAFYFQSGAYREVVVPPGFMGLSKPGVPDPESGQQYSPRNTTRSGQAMEVKAQTIYMIDMDSGVFY